MQHLPRQVPSGVSSAHRGPGVVFPRVEERQAVWHAQASSDTRGTLGPLEGEETDVSGDERPSDEYRQMAMGGVQQPVVTPMADSSSERQVKLAKWSRKAKDRNEARFNLMVFLEGLQVLRLFGSCPKHGPEL